MVEHSLTRGHGQQMRFFTPFETHELHALNERLAVLLRFRLHWLFCTMGWNHFWRFLLFSIASLLQRCQFGLITILDVQCPLKEEKEWQEFIPLGFFRLKFIFSKKATKIDKIFTIDLTFTTYRQINSEDFINFCGLLRKYKL